jgi:hypothetical protein
MPLSAIFHRTLKSSPNNFLEIQLETLLFWYAQSMMEMGRV